MMRAVQQARLEVWTEVLNNVPPEVFFSLMGDKKHWAQTLRRIEAAEGELPDCFLSVQRALSST